MDGPGQLTGTAPEGQVQTALGPVDAASLGFVLCHEHLVWGDCGHHLDTVEGPPPEEVLDAVSADLRRAKAAGVGAVVDPTPPEMGREITLISEASARSGVSVVFATGLYSRWATPYFARRSAAELADFFCTELTDGVGPDRVRPGFVKLAVEAPEPTAHERVALEAGALTHRETGAPLMVHCQAWAATGVLRLLVDQLGVPGSAVVIAHAENVADLGHQLDIVQRYGAYVGFDRFGLSSFGVSDEVRLGLVTALCGLGFADRIHLGHDSSSVRRARGAAELAATKAALPAWDITHIPDRVLPALERAGVAKEQVDVMTRSTVARWLLGAR